MWLIVQVGLSVQVLWSCLAIDLISTAVTALVFADRKKADVPSTGMCTPCIKSSSVHFHKVLNKSAVHLHFQLFECGQFNFESCRCVFLNCKDKEDGICFLACNFVVVAFPSWTVGRSPSMQLSSFGVINLTVLAWRNKFTSTVRGLRRVLLELLPTLNRTEMLEWLCF